MLNIKHLIILTDYNILIISKLTLLNFVNQCCSAGA